MSRQHKKHLCCGRMEADLRDADKTRSHCWSIGPGGTALMYPASDFGTDPKVDYFSLIRTCWSGFPSMPSRSLTSLKGVTSFSVNEEKLPMEKRVFGIRSDGVSIWCVFILRELNSTNQSSCSLTIPFVWKPCWSSSFAETLRRARTSTWVLFSWLLFFFCFLSKVKLTQTLAKTGNLKSAMASLRDDVETQKISDKRLLKVAFL